MNKWIILVVIGVFISSISQIFLKKSSLETYENPIKEYLNFKVIFAYFLFFFTVLISIIAIKNGVSAKELPVIDSLNYIFITFWSNLIFKEKLSKEKLLGLSIIICGIFIFYL